jgi:hypothetical protein
MIVRGEKERLKQRFRDLVILSGSVSVGIAVVMAICNRAFLMVWTQDRISWPLQNDFLMACSLAVYAGTRCHIGLACITKRVGALKYIYFAEGLCFVGLGFALAPLIGLTGVIISGIVTNLCFAGTYGVQRTASYLELTPKEIVFHWLRAPLGVCLVVAAAAMLVWYLTLAFSSWPQLLLRSLVLGSVAALTIWRFGVPPRLRVEVWEKLMRKWQPWSR